MDWLKKHADTVVVLGTLISAITWMNGRFSQLDQKINAVDKEISMIKTVFLIKGIVPAELVKNEFKLESNNGK